MFTPEIIFLNLNVYFIIMIDINPKFKEVKEKLEKENKPNRTFKDFVREFLKEKEKPN